MSFFHLQPSTSFLHEFLLVLSLHDPPPAVKPPFAGLHLAFFFFHLQPSASSLHEFLLVLSLHDPTPTAPGSEQ